MPPGVPSTADKDSEDHGLVRQVAAGSEAALAELYDRHIGAVYRSAYAMSQDRGVAEEVVQETFLALWNRADLFDPSLGSLSGWLVAIAHNRAVDRVRAKARRVPAVPFATLIGDQPDEMSAKEWILASGEVLVAAAPDPEPEEVLMAGEDRAAVAGALARLPGPERQAILLAYRDGLSQSEIATVLGWPLGTVKTRSRRALRRLRDALGEAVSEEEDESECCAAAPA